MAEARDIGDGIHVVPVPVADLPVGDTQVYVMESPRRPVLVDGGWNDDRSWAALQDGLATAGLSVTDVEGVVVTHFHPDHVGLTGRIREASGCWVAMNEADFAHLEVMLSDDDRRPQEAELLRRAGAPEDAIEESLATLVPAIGRPDALPDRKLGADEEIPLTGRTLRTVLTPGHTAGHACFLLEEHGVLFSGDHVLATTTPHVGEFDFPLRNATRWGVPRLAARGRRPARATRTARAPAADRRPAAPRRRTDRPPRPAPRRSLRRLRRRGAHAVGGHRPHALVPAVGRDPLARQEDGARGGIGARPAAHRTRTGPSRARYRTRPLRASAEPMSPDELVTEFCRRWADPDPAELAAFFADDAVFHNIPMEPIRGRAAIEEYIAGFVTSFGAIDYRIHHQAVSGNVVLNERTDVFTMNGRTIELPVTGVFEIVDGKIAACRDYFDPTPFTGN